MPLTLEARFEAQLEELNERLHDCLHPAPGPESRAAQEIIRSLIAGYEAELSALRRHQRGESSRAPEPLSHS